MRCISRLKKALEGRYESTEVISARHIEQLIEQAVNASQSAVEAAHSEGHSNT
jgi:hypothetical protein